jgi:predicted AAA+ superfamily ATPase
VAANEGQRPSRERLGEWFEQWVGLELVRMMRARSAAGRLRFWRDPDGPAVDWVLDQHDRLVPIECKWTDAPSERSARHLVTFLAEYPSAERAFIVCRTPRRYAVARRVDAIPWQDLPELVQR